MRRHLIAAAVPLAALVVGCGASGTAEPTQIAPASSIFYGEAELKPEGSQKEDLDALLRKLPGGGSAGARLSELLEKSSRESKSGLSYERDVKPWLGERAAFFVSGLDSEGQPGAGAAMIATEDEEAAMDAVDKAAKGKARDASYQDIDYKRVDGDTSAGVVQGNLVVGTDRGFRAAVDAAEGDGTPIGDSDAYDKAFEGAPEDRLAFFYFNGPRLVDAARGTLGGTAVAPLARALKEPYVTTLDADADAVELASTLSPSAARLLGPLLGEGSDLIEGLPGDSWAALGQPDLGKALDGYVDLFASAAGGRGVIEQQLRQATGLDLERDITGWMGDFGLFVRGTTVATINGALTIETSDEAASKRALEAVERLLTRSGDAQVGRLRAPGGGEGFTARDSEVPEPLHVFQRDGRVVVAYGDDAARDAVKADEPLGDSPEFDAASDSLGGGYDVSTYIALDPIFDLADSSGAGSDQDWREAKPYLEPLQAMVAGTKKEGDNIVSKVRLTVP